MKKRLYALAVTLLLLLLTAGCAENVQLIETDSGFFGESKKPEPISIPPDAELVEVTPTPQAEESGWTVTDLRNPDSSPFLSQKAENNS